MSKEEIISDIIDEHCSCSVETERMPESYVIYKESDSLHSLLEECEKIILSSFTDNNPEVSLKKKERKKKLLKLILQKFKNDEDDSEELYTCLINLVLTNKRVSEVLQLLFEKYSVISLSFHKKAEELENLIFQIFLKMDPIEIIDYEDSLFIFSENLTKNPENFESIFKFLSRSIENSVFSLYPAFSLCLRKLCKIKKFKESNLLFNYLLHYGMDLSSCVLNYYLETLFHQDLIEQAQATFDKLLEYRPIHTFPEEILKRCKFGKLVISSGVNIVTWGVMIKFLCKNNLLELALLYYEILKSQKIISDEVIFNLLIDGCSKTSNLEQIKSIYFDMWSQNITPTIVTFNTIIDAYIRVRDTEAAWKIFDDLISKGKKPDNFTYSTLFRGIRHASHKVYFQRALEILKVLKKEDIENKSCTIDIILINVLLDCCVSMKEEELLVKLFEQVRTEYYPSVKPDIITFNTFIKGCAQLNLFDKAQEAYELMLKSESLKPNDVFFNTMIDVFVRSNNMDKVWAVIEKMKELEVKPDNFTYSTIIKGLNKNTNFNLEKANTMKSEKPDSSELEIAFRLFDNVKRISQPDEILYNCLMDACLRFDEVDKMMALYKDMRDENIKPSSITCGIMIKAFGKKGKLKKALEVYEQMKREGIEVTSVTYGCLINVCIQNENLQKAFKFYEEIGERNIQMNIVLYTTLIKAYSKNRELDKVLEIFNHMKRDKNNSPNNVTFNSVIDCCVKSGKLSLAENLLDEMLASKIKPDIITFSTIIKGQLKAADLRKAGDYLKMMENFNVRPDDVLLNSLLDGCEKMKKFSKAIEIFEYIRQFNVEPSVMAFSIMMKVYGKLNDYESSKKLMDEVKRKSRNVSLIIFTCYMKTCLSCSKYDEALEVYKGLSNYKLTPDSITFSTILNGLIYNFELNYSQIIIDILKDSFELNIILGDRIYSEIFKKISRTDKGEELKQLLDHNEISYSGKYSNSTHQVSEIAPQGNYNFLINNYKYKGTSGKKIQTGFEYSDKPTPLATIKDAVKKTSNTASCKDFSSTNKISISIVEDELTKDDRRNYGLKKFSYCQSKDSENLFQSDYPISTTANTRFYDNKKGWKKRQDQFTPFSSSNGQLEPVINSSASFKKDQPGKYKKFNRF